MTSRQQHLWSVHAARQYQQGSRNYLGTWQLVC